MQEYHQEQDSNIEATDADTRDTQPGVEKDGEEPWLLMPNQNAHKLSDNDILQEYNDSGNHDTNTGEQLDGFTAQSPQNEIETGLSQAKPTRQSDGDIPDEIKAIFDNIEQIEVQAPAHQLSSDDENVNTQETHATSDLKTKPQVSIDIVNKIRDEVLGITKDFKALEKTPVKSVIDVNHAPVQETEVFASTSIGERLNKIKIQESLMTTFNVSKRNLIDSKHVDELLSKKIAGFRASQHHVADNQSKIYNKLLWINIMADTIARENYTENLKLMDKNITKKVEEFKKLDLEVFKTRNYMDHMGTRLKKIDTDLDDYFISFLKKHKSNK